MTPEHVKFHRFMVWSRLSGFAFFAMFVFVFLRDERSGPAFDLGTSIALQVCAFAMIGWFIYQRYYKIKHGIHRYG